MPHVVASSEVNDVKQGAANGVDPEEVAPHDAGQVTISNDHD
jgi:hypothetical protein